MAIGTSIPLSQAAAGTTEYSATKIRDGVFSVNVSGSGSSKSAPMVITFKPCVTGSRRRHLEASMSLSFDEKHGSPSVDPYGSIKVKLILDSVYGQDMTDTPVLLYLNRFLSSMIQNSNAVITALLSGATE